MAKLYKKIYKGKVYTAYNKKELDDMLWDKKVADKKNK
jgi:hypothetical protein